MMTALVINATRSARREATIIICRYREGFATAKEAREWGERIAPSCGLHSQRNVFVSELSITDILHEKHWFQVAPGADMNGVAQ